ncbi:MAG: hypothetical protein IPH09_13340 [bacterium]|nr:hypothetical protein [bacterium]
MGTFVTIPYGRLMSPYFRQLSDVEFRLLTTLLTFTDTNALGICGPSRKKLGRAINRTTEEVEECLQSLSRRGCILYDPDDMAVATTPALFECGLKPLEAPGQVIKVINDFRQHEAEMSQEFRLGLLKLLLHQLSQSKKFLDGRSPGKDQQNEKAHAEIQRFLSEYRH